MTSTRRSDKTGLPVPLILANYFSVRDDKIVTQITILDTPQRPEVY